VVEPIAAPQPQPPRSRMCRRRVCRLHRPSKLRAIILAWSFTALSQRIASMRIERLLGRETCRPCGSCRRHTSDLGPVNTEPGSRLTSPALHCTRMPGKRSPHERLPKESRRFSTRTAACRSNPELLRQNSCLIDAFVRPILLKAASFSPVRHQRSRMSSAPSDERAVFASRLSCRRDDVASGAMGVPCEIFPAGYRPFRHV